MNEGAIVFKFQSITENSLDIALEIINSNPDYNTIEGGRPFRTIEEVREMFINEKTDSYFIMMESKYVGIIDFLKNNPSDNYPWIGLLMIHGDYHSMGYGKKSYISFEKELKKQNFANVRIGILEKNIKAKKFWSSLGFEFYEEKKWKEEIIHCFEKSLLKII